jgi:two-component system sensor histidine kinase DctS
VSPRDLVDSVLPLVRLQARKLMIDLSLHLPDDLPKIWCDRAMVEQVILNLARNGMQAMSEASARTRRALSISLILTHGPQETEQLCVEVADLGNGIDAEVEINLYTPFFTTKEEGMGLGLSLCRTVVEQHGGQLSHRSNQPCGTVFSFTLPYRSNPIPGEE